MIQSDFHTHTIFSGDSQAPVSAVIEQAIHLGLKRLCITDHQDFDFPIQPNDPVSFDLDLPTYIEVLTKARAKYADKIQLLIGIELGVMDYQADQLSKFIKQFPFDFVIASSHLIDGADPYNIEYFQERTEYEATFMYFDAILRNLNVFTDFNVYGHLDYIIRYAPNKNQNFSLSDYSDIIDNILKKIISLGKGIELNTAGIKYGLSQPHPHMDILKRYKQLGGEILTVGSDAHKPEHLAYSFDQVPSILSEAGFKYYTVFQQQKPIFLKV